MLYIQTYYTYCFSEAMQWAQSAQSTNLWFRSSPPAQCAVRWSLYVIVSNQ